MSEHERAIRDAVAGAFAEHEGPRLDVTITEVIEAAVLALYRALREERSEVPEGWKPCAWVNGDGVTIAMDRHGLYMVAGSPGLPAGFDADNFQAAAAAVARARSGQP